MKVKFLGVGEAFDRSHTNVSMVVEVDDKNILLDCGYSVPHAVWKHNPYPDFLDAIWISHAHADHFFGLGPLLVRMKEDGREKPLYLLTRPDVKEKLEEVLELSYPGSIQGADFDVNFVEFEDETTWGDVRFEIASTQHAVPNKAIRIEHEGKAFCYSGDGKMLPETRELYRNADLLVQEAYTIEEDLDNHGNVKSLVSTMKTMDISRAALAHIRRDVRAHGGKLVSYLGSVDQQVLLPEDGDTLTL